MKQYWPLVLGVLILLLGTFLVARNTYAAPFPYAVGGTGSSTVPAKGQIFYAGATAWQSRATTSVACSGTVSCSGFDVLGNSPITITGASSGSAPVATSSAETSGRVPFWTSTAATPALLSGGVSGFTWDSTNNRLTATNASTTALTVGSGTGLAQLTAGTISAYGSTGLVLTTSGVAAAYAGTSCTNQFPRSLSASGVATCATVSSGDVSLANLTATDGTLTFSGTYNGSTARTIGLNLSSTNNWLTAIAVGTTTPWGALSVSTTTSQNTLPLFVVGSSTNSNIPLQVNGFGKTVGNDQVNSFVGVLSPTHRLVLSTGTTTAWTASTTNSAYSPFITAPFSGTVRQVYCLTDASFVGVNIQVNGSNIAPSYFVASTTPGVVPFTSGNTFTRGQKILANFGTTTTATTLEVSCTLDFTETP